MASTADAAGGLEREAAPNASAKATATASRPVAFFILLLPPPNKSGRPIGRRTRSARLVSLPRQRRSADEHPNSVTRTALGVSSTKGCALPGWRRGVKVHREGSVGPVAEPEY